MTNSSNARLFDVVSVLFGRTLKVRYRGSILGVLWSAVSPLAMAAVYAAIFGRVFSPYYDNSLWRYAAAVYLGLALVGLFVSGTSQALPSIVQNSGLLNKIRIPFEAFPLSAVAAYAFQQTIGTVPLMIVLSLIINHDVLHVVALAVPLAALAMLTVGVALLMSGADVFFRDIPYLYDLATFFLWVTTPVFYPALIAPARVHFFLAINPLYQVLESVRTLVLTSDWPSAVNYWVPLGEGTIVLIIGVVGFGAMRRHFMERL